MTNQYALGYKAGLEAAVKVCRDGMECTTDETIKSAVSMVAYQIAALPVPEVQWRDLTDDEEIVIASTPDKSRHWLVCEAISKFKEKQL